MTVMLTKPLTPFVDELPVPRRLVATEHAGRLTVSMGSGTHRFHRDLPESTVWRYGGTVPGPTVEAERGRPVTVDWVNELEGPLPLAVTIAPSATDADGVPVQCHPGLSGGSPDDKAAALSGHAVVHLHGGLTPASYDGWAENLFSPGQTAVFHYPMDQRASLLWYHDHVMGVTKYHVYAGLAGLWIIRDERERELGLPEGLPFEVPLLIQDRNFDLDERGQLTGLLVHKTDPEVMEAFPPFTVVNGKVWPVLDVQPATYRFRVLNGSNARTYRLVLVHDGRPELGRITQIGTDHGLLRRAVAVPADGLVLAPAERADLIVDFSDLDPGSELTLLNTASAPFDGAAFPAADAERATDLDGLLPYPEVMRLRVVAGPSEHRAPPRDARHRLRNAGAGRARRRTAAGDRARGTRARGRAEHAHHARAGAGRRRRRGRPARDRHRRRADDALPDRRGALRGRDDFLPDARAIRGVAAHQSDRGHAPDPPPPGPLPGRLAARDQLPDPGRRHPGPSPDGLG